MLTLLPSKVLNSGLQLVKRVLQAEQVVQIEWEVQLALFIH